MEKILSPETAGHRHEFQRFSICCYAGSLDPVVINIDGFPKISSDIAFFPKRLFQAEIFGSRRLTGTGSVHAKTELHTAMTAAKEKSVPNPKRTQIQPPTGAAMIEIR